MTSTFFFVVDAASGAPGLHEHLDTLTPAGAVQLYTAPKPEPEISAHVLPAGQHWKPPGHATAFGKGQHAAFFAAPEKPLSAHVAPVGQRTCAYASVGWLGHSCGQGAADESDAESADERDARRTAVARIFLVLVYVLVVEC